MAETQTEMTENKPVQKAMSGFAKRNANKERIEQEEKELQELMSRESKPTEEVESDTDEVDESVDQEPTSGEEKTFKKRYGDLRRHAQKKEQEFQKQIDDLKSQLEASTRKELKYPKSEDELTAWMEKYPDVAKIVETIAMKKAQEQSAEYENKFKEIDDMRVQALREKAEAKLMKMHPDFLEIRDSDEFHQWVEKQPKWIQDALYDNDTDAMSASRAIDLYKADKGIKIKRKGNKGAEQAVSGKSSRNSPDVADNSGKIRESDIMRMSAAQYEQVADEVAEAIRNGKFIYDVSGSAR
jgi:hypothetical protein